MHPDAAMLGELMGTRIGSRSVTFDLQVMGVNCCNAVLRNYVRLWLGVWAGHSLVGKSMSGPSLSM